ncbi:CBO0543 family protein [Bacillus sp. 31A1R]|uniref:CBO0543 family protein n=1 Tax=Robertmurraya mangrovi TaxID=3098077 RepID=A0ABU5J0Q6_9BACI|nr:CBO0543 family protein [Bacillus sp. 31A1R]MDZ5472930.1 CBO0543 family protein [Bacillus sp. 31A1R]
MNALYALVWLFALIKWGDYKNWKKYYPTFLFFVVGDFAYHYLLSDIYPMWRYTPQGFDKNIDLTNTHISLSVMAVKYPATTLIYLSKFPKENMIYKILYVAGWVCLYTINEGIDLKLHLIKHFNGWNLYWSILFNIFIFSILKIHFTRPIVAWLLSFIFIVFLWNVFNVPKEVFR